MQVLDNLQPVNTSNCWECLSTINKNTSYKCYIWAYLGKVHRTKAKPRTYNALFGPYQFCKPWCADNHTKSIRYKYLYWTK